MSKQRKNRAAVPRSPAHGAEEACTGRRNPVAKFDWRVNRSAVQIDRKKAQARGYRKHRSLDLPPSVSAA